MANSDYGFSGLNSTLNSSLSGTSNDQVIGNSARVISIVLNEDHPRFTDLGGYSALGAIEYNLTTNLSYRSGDYPVAYPLYPNIKNYPLINEVVLITSAFDKATNLFEKGIPILSGRTKKYYTSIVKVWNTPHHNGYSFNINRSSPSSQKSYDQVENGSEAIIPDEPYELNLGETFKERDDIHPLKPFEGDVIHEGRWGNSIRLSSTIKPKNNPTQFKGLSNWSGGQDTTTGDPILIIRNGQGNRGIDNGFEPIEEDINFDESSIYLTSTQKIPIEAESIDYSSYTKNNPAPIEPKAYSGQQIILSSGRLVFNSYNDHILLSSNKTINLNSILSVNIDSPTLSIKSTNIYLGENSDYKKNEPLMLGNQTAKLLKILVKSLSTFMQLTSIATTNKCVPGEATTLPVINSAAKDVLDDLYNLSKELGSDENLKDCNLISKRNYTV